MFTKPLLNFGLCLCYIGFICTLFDDQVLSCMFGFILILFFIFNI